MWSLMVSLLETLSTPHRSRALNLTPNSSAVLISTYGSPAVWVPLRLTRGYQNFPSHASRAWRGQTGLARVGLKGTEGGRVCRMLSRRYRMLSRGRYTSGPLLTSVMGFLRSTTHIWTTESRRFGEKVQKSRKEQRVGKVTQLVHRHHLH